MARPIPPQTYFKHQHDRIAQLLNDSTTLVACPAGDDDTILGWVCGKPGLVHWVYVKRTWRGIGIGQKLVGTLGAVGEGGEYTHLPASETRIFPSWSYNPYLG